MRIAMIGTRGVPARYGGFETAVEEIGARLAERDHEIIVYCRNPGQRERHHRGMRLVNLPAIRTRSMETLSHSLLSTAHAVITARPDMAFVFNPANAPVIPLLRAAGVPVAVNVDGLESERAKWQGPAARYLRWAEVTAMRSADVVIADSRVIAEHVRARSGRDAVYIPYGAGPSDEAPERLRELDLEWHGYVLAVARLEPENQIDVIIEGYRDVPGDMPLVVVGANPYPGEHVARVRALAAADARVRLLGSIHDQQMLDTLYAGARLHVHGHAVGGTNPSLLRAARVAPVLAYDTPFAREVLGYGAQGYWQGTSDFCSQVVSTLRAQRVPALADIIDSRFSWDCVARDYEVIARLLVTASLSLPNRNQQDVADPLASSFPIATVRPVQHKTSKGAA
jgi:glycosyltransferase involved in cell wall biosynthesis